MITLLPIATAQEVSVLIRDTASSYTAVIVNEETTTSTSQVIAANYSDGLLTFDLTYSFAEGRFYWLRINNTSTGRNLNKSKIYATEQTDFQTYDLTDGYYDEIVKTKTDFYVKESS